jgi:hypothetical protein
MWLGRRRPGGQHPGRHGDEHSLPYPKWYSDQRTYDVAHVHVAGEHAVRQPYAVLGPPRSHAR